MQLNLCKKQTNAKFPSTPRQLTRNLLYVNRNPNSKDVPYLQRPFIRYRDRLYLKTHIPPSTEIYTLYHPDDGIQTPQWEYALPKTSGYPTPKFTATPPPSRSSLVADTISQKTPPLSPISDRSEVTTNPLPDPS